MKRLDRYLRMARTVRHLRFPQIYWRVVRKFHRPTASTAPAPPRRAVSGTWVEPPARPSVMLGPTTFRLLNQVHEAAKPADWNFKADAKVNVYNLHYFDDLTMAGWEDRRDWHRSLIRRWIAEVPQGEGLGWDAYPTSLRLVNWVKWLLAGNDPEPGMLDSLALQTRHLCNNIEWQLMGNHVLANAKGILFAGAFLGGEEGDGWIRKSFPILAGEFREEILADGGHYERSPMYHSIMLEDILDAINVAQAFGSALTESERTEAATWNERAARMLAFLGAVLHPDGEVSQFNDAGRGIAPSQEELEEYAERLGLSSSPPPGEGVQVLSETGFIRVQRGPLWLLADVGEVGPTYQPAHAHADTLSFEASLFGERLLVNSGTSTYAISPLRDAERGTAAHNTVVVDGENSSEVWASFRVARRAMPFDVSADASGTEWRVQGAHDGYHRLPGRVTHRRSWRIGETGLIVEDRLEGSFSKAEAFYHFAPEVHAQLEDGAVVGELRGQRFRLELAGGALRLEPYSYSPDFGKLVPSVCAVGTFEGDAITATLTWHES